MGEEDTKKSESEAVSEPTPTDDHQDPTHHATQEKETSLNDVSKKDAEDLKSDKSSKDSTERDVVLARVETEKRHALIQAWEENEKAKVDNNAHKRISAIGSWKNTQIAYAEANIKKFEEKMERKKAEYAEKMKNKVAEIRKAAEEKRATVEAKRSEDIVKVHETAEKFRETGQTPRTFLGCFSF